MFLEGYSSFRRDFILFYSEIFKRFYDLDRENSLELKTYEKY